MCMYNHTPIHTGLHEHTHLHTQDEDSTSDGDKRSSSQNDVKIVILIRTLSKLRVMPRQVKCVIFAGTHTRHYRQS